jgi:hypothetical protein
MAGPAQTHSDDARLERCESALHHSEHTHDTQTWRGQQRSIGKGIPMQSSPRDSASYDAHARHVCLDGSTPKKYGDCGGSLANSGIPAKGGSAVLLGWTCSCGLGSSWGGPAHVGWGQDGTIITNAKKEVQRSGSPRMIAWRWCASCGTHTRPTWD